MNRKENSRRRFLKWLGLAPGVFVLGSVACGDEVRARPPGRDGGRDGGRGGDAGSDSGVDAGRPGDPDAGGVTSDGGVDAAGDAANPDGGAPDTGAETCEPTGSDVEGPFHIDGAPTRTVLADANEPGERLIIEGTVYGPDCRTPVAGALLDVWHADADGNYHDGTTDYRLRGMMQTDENGRYRFETIKPGRYPLGNSTRPAHIHFIVSKPGFLPLTTQLYFEGDPFLSPNDPCGNSCNSGDPTLIIPLSDASPMADFAGTFDIVVQSM